MIDFKLDFYKFFYKYFIITSLLISCGEGCKTPDEDSSWVPLSQVTAYPINKDVVIDVQNPEDEDVGIGMLKDGTTNAIAGENLWVTPQVYQTQKGSTSLIDKIATIAGTSNNSSSYQSSDAIFQIGDRIKVSVNASDAVILSGSIARMTFKQRPIQMENYGIVYDGTKIKYTPMTRAMIPGKYAKYRVKAGSNISLFVSNPNINNSIDYVFTNTNGLDTATYYNKLVNNILDNISTNSKWPLVKSIGGSEYIPLKYGNGLVMQIVPKSQGVDFVDPNLYTNPDLWQCNVGPSGSYNLHQEALPSPITAAANPSWIWFSGYDFYKDNGLMNYHLFNIGGLNVVDSKGNTPIDSSLINSLKIEDNLDNWSKFNYYSYTNKTNTNTNDNIAGFSFIRTRYGPFAGFNTNQNIITVPYLLGKANSTDNTPHGVDLTRRLDAMKTQRWEMDADTNETDPFITGLTDYGVEAIDTYRADSNVYNYYAYFTDAARVKTKNTISLNLRFPYRIARNNYGRLVQKYQLDSAFASSTSSIDIQGENITFNNKYQKCTFNWKNNGWALFNPLIMLDPKNKTKIISNNTTHKESDHGLSGSYLNSSAEFSASDLENSVHLSEVHKKFGGLINNNVFIDQKPGYDFKDSYTVNPNFNTVYDKQVIYIRNILSDPLNANGSCDINMRAGGVNYPYKMDMSFGLDSSTRNTYLSQTSNGRLPGKFFRITKDLRNAIASGLVPTGWHKIGGIIRDKTNITFSSSGYFYPQHNLTFSNGWENGGFNDQDYSDASNLVLTPDKFGMYNDISNRNGGAYGMYGGWNVMTAGMSLYKEQADFIDKRIYPIIKKCGNGVAFRVIPITNYQCIGGYKLKCNNNRINDAVEKQYNAQLKGQDDAIKGLCNSISKDGAKNVGICYNNKIIQDKNQSIVSSEYIPISYNKYIADISGVIQYLQYDNASFINNISEVKNYNLTDWTLHENIYQDHCGFCVEPNMVQRLEGKDYIFQDLNSIYLTNPIDKNLIATKGGCVSAGKRWITNFNSISTTFNAQVDSNIRMMFLNNFIQILSMYNLDSSKFVNIANVQNGTQESLVKYKNNVYNLKQNINNLSAINDLVNCELSATSLYNLNLEYLQLDASGSKISIPKEAQDQFSNSVLLSARTICQNLYDSSNLEIVSNNIKFLQNEYSGSCTDSKINISNLNLTDFPTQNLISIKTQDSTATGYQNILVGIGEACPIDSVENGSTVVKEVSPSPNILVNTPCSSTQQEISNISVPENIMIYDNKMCDLDSSNPIADYCPNNDHCKEVPSNENLCFDVNSLWYSYYDTATTGYPSCSSNTLNIDYSHQDYSSTIFNLYNAGGNPGLDPLSNNYMSVKNDSAFFYGTDLSKYVGQFICCDKINSSNCLTSRQVINGNTIYARALYPNRDCRILNSPDSNYHCRQIPVDYSFNSFVFSNTSGLYSMFSLNFKKDKCNVINASLNCNTPISVDEGNFSQKKISLTPNISSCYTAGCAMCPVGTVQFNPIQIYPITYKKTPIDMTKGAINQQCAQIDSRYYHENINNLTGVCTDTSYTLGSGSCTPRNVCNANEIDDGSIVIAENDGLPVYYYDQSCPADYLELSVETLPPNSLQIPVNQSCDTINKYEEDTKTEQCPSAGRSKCIESPPSQKYPNTYIYDSNYIDNSVKPVLFSDSILYKDTNYMYYTSYDSGYYKKFNFEGDCPVDYAESIRYKDAYIITLPFGVGCSGNQESCCALLDSEQGYCNIDWKGSINGIYGVCFLLEFQYIYDGDKKTDSLKSFDVSYTDPSNNKYNAHIWYYHNAVQCYKKQDVSYCLPTYNRYRNFRVCNRPQVVRRNCQKQKNVTYRNCRNYNICKRAYEETIDCRQIITDNYKICRNYRYCRRPARESKDCREIVNVPKKICKKNFKDRFGGELINVDTSNPLLYPIGSNYVPNITIPSVKDGVNFDYADLYFWLAPPVVDSSNNILNDIEDRYGQFKFENVYDPSRGYVVDFKSTIENTNGKYLYFYFQPLDTKGKPDPIFHPETYFAGKSALDIKNNPYPKVYSFQDYQDSNGAMNFSVIQPGKLWFIILDMYEADVNGLNKYTGADGKFIEFSTNNGDEQVSGFNYNGYNVGYYTLSSKAQFNSTTNDSVLSSLISMSNNFIGILIVRPVKNIFFGSWDATKNDYNWTEGLIYRVATGLTSNAVVQMLYYFSVLIYIFVFGINVLLGKVKIEVKDFLHKAWNFALITAFASPGAWNLYQKIFVKFAIDISEGLIAMSSGSFSSSSIMIDGYNTKLEDPGFGPISETLRFILKSGTFERIIALIFSSVTGIFIAALIFISFTQYILNVFKAILLYVGNLIVLSIYLMLGPISFIALANEETKDIFDNWWKNIISTIAQQVALFVGLSIFTIIFLSMIKGLLNFTICFDPIIQIPIVNLTLFSMWRVAGHIPPVLQVMMGVTNSENEMQSIGIIDALLVYLMVNLLDKFVDESVKLGTEIFGGQESGLTQMISSEFKKIKDTVSVTGALTKVGSAVKKIV